MNDNYSKKRPSVPNPDVGNLVRCTGPILSDKNYIKRLNQISEEERKRSISAPQHFVKQRFLLNIK